MSPPQRKRLVAVALTGGLLAPVPFLAGTLVNESRKPVEAAVVEPRLVQPSVLASGQIAHEDEIRLTSEVVGTVEALHVMEGQPVERGQLVLSIDDDAYAADVVQNRAAVRLEEIDIDRRRARVANLLRQHARNARLFERRLLDAHSLEAVRHELELARIDLQAGTERLHQARARLGQAESRLEKTRLRAPIDGVVTALDIEAGETAIPSSTNIPGSQLMTIADPTSLFAEVYVDEADIAAVRVGQSAEIVAVAHPGRPLAGEVEFVANTARTEQHRRSLSFLARIRVTPTDGVRLRPGMSCRAEIFTRAAEEGLAVPIQAIVTNQRPRGGTRQFVFVFRDGIAHKLPVVTGSSDDAYQEITSGLQAGDRVITGPARTLRSLSNGDAVHADTSPTDLPDGPARLPAA